jgi:hypothetical protein
MSTGSEFSDCSPGRAMRYSEREHFASMCFLMCFSMCFTLVLVGATLPHKTKTRKGGRIMGLTACNGFILEKLPVAQLLNNFPTYYRVQMGPPPAPILSHINPVHIAPF